MRSCGWSNMTFPVPLPLSDAKALAEGSSVYSLPVLGRDAARHSMNDRSAGGRLAPVRQNIHPRRRKLPALQHLNSERLERTQTFIPPLPRDYLHRPGNQHRFGLSKELSPSHLVRPFTLGSHVGYDLNTNPAFILPSALVVNGRNTFPVDNKFNRPKVNDRPSNLFTIKNNEKMYLGKIEHSVFSGSTVTVMEYPGQSYPDPTVGAPRCFIHRISELSCLEGETVRQEKLKKMRKAQDY